MESDVYPIPTYPKGAQIRLRGRKRYKDLANSRYARTLAAKKDLGDEFALIERIERLAPQVMRDHGMTKPICANIDLYTGFIYKMLGVPETLFTPLFAVARMAGWSAHRMEELFCAHRIIRPAYRPVIEPLEYKPLADR